VTADPTIAAALERRAALFHADPAIVHGNMVLSWGELEDQAARLAAFLAARGIEPGARVAIGMNNHPLYLMAVFAALKIRAVPVNVNHRYKATELRHVLADSGASVLVHDSALTAALAAVRAELPALLLDVCTEAAALADESVPIYAALSGRPMERGAPAGNAEWLLYTGGTTSLPKPVATPQRAILDNISRLSAYLLGEELPGEAAELDKVLVKHHATRPVVLIAPPLMHATGLYGALAALLAGGAVVLLGGRQYDPAELAAQIPRHQVTHLFIVGDAFALPLADELDSAAAAGDHYDLSSLRRILSVGTAWSASVKQRLLAHADVTLRDTIAATEGGPFALAEADRSTPPRQLTAFRLTPGARLIAPDGSDVRPGSETVGMLAAPAEKGTRYANNPDKTSTTFRSIDGLLYAMPGDLARMNPDGTLRLLGRGSGVINTGGEKVFAAEVEEVLLAHPAITDAVVVGIPHPRWGTVVAAVVAAKPGQEPEPDALSAHVAAELADYKKPRHIVVVPKVMRTVSGKPDLKWARDVLSAELPHGPFGLDERFARHLGATTLTSRAPLQ
jgi:acyl-CoA synthetase (AMP-forming)/AMP-acid ligase II